MRRITANYIFPVVSQPLPKGLIEIGDNGEIISVIPNGQYLMNDSIETYNGIIVPGFVNTHCHLELSHLKGKLRENNGIIHFLSDVRSQRQVSRELIDKAMLDADTNMKNEGIVAVGDISNTDHSFVVKKKSSIIYHTFIEVYGVDKSLASDRLNHANHLKAKAQSLGLPASVTVHAPYSLSKELKQSFFENIQNDDILSIHHQESKDEIEMIEQKSGELLNLMVNMGLDKAEWLNDTVNLMDSLFGQAQSTKNILLVHNTFTNIEVIKKLVSTKHKVTWVLCPNSNMYIQNTLPNVNVFIENNCSVALGTDSYASNTSLSVLEEIKTLHQHFPQISLTDLISWATLNGARALNIDTLLGSFEVGKKPGVNLIKDIDLNSLQITNDCKVEPIFP